MKIMLVDAPQMLVEALAWRDGVEVVALTPSPKIKKLSAALPQVEYFPYATTAKVDFRAISQLRTAVHKTKPDLIHAYYSRPLANAVLATSWMRSPPPIVSVRANERVPSWRDPSEYISYLHPRVAGHATESLAVVDALERGGVPRDRCSAIYFGVKTGAKKPGGREALAELGVPRDAFVVGTVATIRPVKGIDILLRAAIECADLANVYWLLVGPVNDAKVDRLAHHPAIRDRVRLAGFRNDAVKLASAFDLFVMPSRQEAICRALLEAMSQRVCPIVSDAGGMKEVCRNGIDGLVVPREDIAALSSAIRQLHDDDDLRARYAASSYERVRTEFSPERMADRALELYRRVLARRQPLAMAG